MRSETIEKPVGVRWRSITEANLADDQATVIGLLADIQGAQGGQKELWTTPPRAGASGTCPQPLAEAIWTFQTHWKTKGEFAVIDGVVDPAMNTLKKMNALAPDKPAPQPEMTGPVSTTHQGPPHKHE